MYNINLSTSVVATVLLIIATSILIRLAHVIRCIQNDRRRDINILQTTSNSNEAKNNNNKKQQQVKTMIILGSGGHTTEMIRLLQELDPCTYTPIIYVLAESDTTSIERLQKYIKEEEVYINGSIDEKRKKRSSSRWIGRYPIEKSSNHYSSSIDSSKQSSVASVYRLPRAREVHQSYYTSILTTIHSFLQTLILLNKVQPELLLTNGPGTCIPVIYSLFLHRLLSFKRTSCKIIFVESLCRVQTLSLSGKLVYPIVDRFIVHWSYLKEKYPLVDVCDVFVRHDGNSVDSSSKDK